MKKPDCKSRIFEERIHLTGTSGSAFRRKLSGMSFLCARTRMLTPAKWDRISQIKKEHFVLSNKKYHQYSYSIISPKTSLSGNRPGAPIKVYAVFQKLSQRLTRYLHDRELFYGPVILIIIQYSCMGFLL